MNAIVNRQQAELLNDFGTSIGLQLTFDDAGQCLLMVDELQISIRARDERFVFYGLLGEFPAALPADFWKHVLSLNADLVEQQLGAITIDLASDTLSVVLAVDAATMGPSQLSSALREFVDQMTCLVAWLGRETAVLYVPGADGIEGRSALRRADDLFNRLA